MNQQQYLTITRPLKLLFVGDSLTPNSSTGPFNVFDCDLSNENAFVSNYTSVSSSIGPTKEQKIAWIFISNGLEEYLYSANSIMPDYIFIPISVGDGVTAKTKEYIGIILTLNRPVVILLSKTELTKESEYAATLKIIETIVTKWMKKKIAIISNDNSRIPMEKIVRGMSEGAIVPVVTTSAGGDVQKLRQMISSLESNQEPDNKGPCEIWISKAWNVADGKIACEGIIKTGKLQANKYLRLGPLNNQFYTIIVKRISTYKDNVESAETGNRILFEATLLEEKKLRMEGQRMIAVEKVDKKRLTREFDAEIAVLTEESIKVDQTITIFSGNIHRTAKIEDTEKEELTQGDRGIIRCKLDTLEWMKVGEKVFLVSNGVRGLGVITKTY